MTLKSEVWPFLDEPLITSGAFSSSNAASMLAASSETGVTLSLIATPLNWNWLPLYGSITSGISYLAKLCSPGLTTTFRVYFPGAISNVFW